MRIPRCLVGALVLAAACEGPTGILVEVSMSTELREQLGPDARSFDTLRIFVGHATTEPSRFTSADGAFRSFDSNEVALDAGFRYLLEPDRASSAIGPVMVAAAVGNAADRTRFEIIGFAAAPTPTRFAAGEVRVLEFVLEPGTGAQSGAHDVCVRWSGAHIVPIDDRDCDGAIGTDDCDDRDPSRNLLDIDRDGVSSCAGDCMEFSDGPLPWVDPAEVHPGSMRESQSLTCTHVDYDCDGFCGDPTRDWDGSGTTDCGGVALGEHVCPVVPADCDEARPGDNPAASNEGEACNARDDACDTFLPPPLPCFFRDGGGTCHTGVARCDEREGEYAGERDGALSCEPGGGVSAPATIDAACAHVADAACLESPDPLACGTDGLQVPRIECRVSARGGGPADCRPDRRPLTPPLGGSATQCQWFVVGGVDQAEWEVGFVAADAPLDAVPAAMSSQCAPHLAVRSRVPNPAPRTALLLVGGGLGGATLQPVIAKLHAGADTCTGLLLCTGSDAVLPPQ